MGQGKWCAGIAKEADTLVSKADLGSKELSFMSEAIAIYLLFMGALAVAVIVAQSLGYEFKGGHTFDFERKKAGDFEQHDVGNTIHWSDHHHHPDHGSSF